MGNPWEQFDTLLIFNSGNLFWPMKTYFDTKLSVFSKEGLFDILLYISIGVLVVLSFLFWQNQPSNIFIKGVNSWDGHEMDSKKFLNSCKYELTICGQGVMFLEASVSVIK